jgi:hypothetical protein
MKHRIIILGTTVTACLAFVATALIQKNSAAIAETARTRLAPRQEELARQLALNQERIKAAEAEQHSLRTMREAKPAALMAAQPGQAKVLVMDPKIAATAEAIARMPWRDIVLEKSPDLQARYLVAKRRDLGVSYGPFVAELGLPPDQAGRFLEIKLAAVENTMDLNSTTRSRGMTESDPAVQAMRRQSEETMQAAERDLLGEAGYQRLVEFERTLPARDYVGGIAASLVFSGDPLSPAQASQLTQILAEASETYRNGAHASGPQPNLDEPMRLRQSGRESIDSTQALAQARAVLSPTQYAVLEADLLRYRSIMDLFNVLRQAPADPIVGFTIVGRN